MDNPEGYTIKEFIAHTMSDINDKIDDIHADVKEIKEQTIKTNGRVSKLEFWRGAVLWALAALWTLIILIGPWFVKNVVEDSVKQALIELK